MNIVPPPPQFDARFSEFYERFVEPNLPSVQKVRAFDTLLRQYLSNEDPVHVVRYVRGQTRGTIYRTGQGWRIFPTDNAPVWWTHALLHSETALPKENASALFGTMPHHFFKVARFQTLNQAGYHAAHILSAKNGDTDWRSWMRDELARRMLVNIHPCNMFLVAKQEWARNGGRRDIIAWITSAYLDRYGATMEKFLADVDPSASPNGGPVDDPVYRYGTDAVGEASRVTPAPLSWPPRYTPPKTGPVDPRPTKRPVIWRDLVGKGVSLDLSMQGARYLLPHDDLVAWVAEHTRALQTASWNEQGIYSWPRATTAMLQFLRHYEVQE